MRWNCPYCNKEKCYNTCESDFRTMKDAMQKKQSLTELIQDSVSLILDRPEEAQLIHYVLTEFDDEMRAAFVLAYRIVQDQKNQIEI